MAEDAQQHQKRAKRYGQVVVKAWTDAAFRHRLLHDPRGALAECGIAVPADHEVRVVEDTPRLTHFVLPAKPEELTADQLAQVAGGSEPVVQVHLTPTLPVYHVGDRAGF